MLGCGACAVAGNSLDAELTGLVDLPSAKMASIRISGGRTVTLNLGEASEGLLLQKLDVVRGLAVIGQGTNHFELRLRNYVLTLSDPAPPPRDMAKASLFEARRGELASASDADDQAVAFMLGSNTSNPAATPGGSPQGAGFLGGATGPTPSTGTGAAAAQSPGNSASDPSQIPSPTFSLPPEISAPDEITAQEPLPKKPPFALKNPPPADPEGDRIMSLYGSTAFLSWDLSHASRWEQASPAKK